MLSRRIRSGLLQVHPREDGFEIDGVQVVSESVMAEEVDVLPCDGGDPLEQFQGLPVVRRLVAVEQSREQHGIVGDDGIGDQASALVADSLRRGLCVLSVPFCR